MQQQIWCPPPRRLVVGGVTHAAAAVTYLLVLTTIVAYSRHHAFVDAYSSSQRPPTSKTWLVPALNSRPRVLFELRMYQQRDAEEVPLTSHSSSPRPPGKARLNVEPSAVAQDNDGQTFGGFTAKASRAKSASLLSLAIMCAAGVVIPTLALKPEPAHATYSAYARREQDWSERASSGQIQFSSARALKKQLRDIAPMNTAKSLLFCPNGPSSNVSPLMENRCGDQLAAPSVFGRSDDVVGNSIPGFSQRPSAASGNDLLTPASVGGFLPYGGGTR